MIPELLIGAAGSMLGAFGVWLLLRSGRAVALFGASYPLARRLNQEGVTAFRFSRGDYTERLPDYLSHAKTTISIVSISLKITDTEAALLSLFRRFLISNPASEVRISLLNPLSHVLPLAAASLDVSADTLKREIIAMLRGLFELRDSHGIDRRLDIRIHERLPMGSAILLDATPEAGTIQVEQNFIRLHGLRALATRFVALAPFTFGIIERG